METSRKNQIEDGNQTIPHIMHSSRKFLNVNATDIVFLLERRLIGAGNPGCPYRFDDFVSQTIPGLVVYSASSGLGIDISVQVDSQTPITMESIVSVRFNALNTPSSLTKEDWENRFINIESGIVTPDGELYLAPESGTANLSISLNDSGTTFLNFVRYSVLFKFSWTDSSGNPQISFGSIDPLVKITSS